MVIDTAFWVGLANMRNIDTLRGKDEASKLFGATAQRLKKQREVSSHNMNQTIRYLVLLLTTACNLRCAYSYRQELSDPEPMPRDVGSEGLRLAAATGRPLLTCSSIPQPWV
jgi:sulfatase maturation enzyme AslB (radical SAM superfamily)